MMAKRFMLQGLMVASLMPAAPVLAQTAAEVPPPYGCKVIPRGAELPASKSAAHAVFPEPQLEIRTPLTPTILPSAGRYYMIYELYLRNFSDQPFGLDGLEILAVGPNGEQVLSALNQQQLKNRWQAAQPLADDAKLSLAAGQGAVVFLCLAFDALNAVPAKLRHRLVTERAPIDGPAIPTRSTRLHVLGNPLVGSNWGADHGPSLHSHHRTGVLVAGGLARISRRYAFDWRKHQAGKTFAGDARDVRAYFAYGEPVLAVADGKVLAARDGMPDNIPRTKDGFTPAVPITSDSIPGNFVMIELGDGQIAQYAHLQPGSVRVKAGDTVRRGQPIARVGNSGDAREPHLHFQVADAADLLASEGLPYVLERFAMRMADGKWEVRTAEFPLDGALIDFAASGSAPP